MGRDGLGELEHLVLLAILRLGEEAYGVPILDEIERRTNRPTSRGSVYVTLSRLESKGLVSAALSEPTAARGGRAKKFYSVTPAGVERLKSTRTHLLQMWDGLEEWVGP